MPEKTTLCTFYVDQLFFGIQVDQVQEVLRAQQMTDVPLSPPVIRGLMNLRGQIVTALDMRVLLGLPSSDDEKATTMNVLVRAEGGLVSLLVDQIGDVIDVSTIQFESPPKSVPQVVLKLVKGVYKLDDQLLLLLNTDQLIAHEGFPQTEAAC